MTETAENPTIALSSFKTNWRVPKSWGLHIKDTHSHCISHFILDLIISCAISIYYPCVNRMNGQVKIKTSKKGYSCASQTSFRPKTLRCHLTFYSRSILTHAPQPRCTFTQMRYYSTYTHELYKYIKFTCIVVCL